MTPAPIMIPATPPAYNPDTQKLTRHTRERFAYECGEVRTHRTKHFKYVVIPGFHKVLLPHDKVLIESYRILDRVYCAACTEEIAIDDYGWYKTTEEVGEFIDNDGNNKTCHAQCGLDNGWELA